MMVYLAFCLQPSAKKKKKKKVRFSLLLKCFVGPSTYVMAVAVSQAREKQETKTHGVVTDPL